MADTGSLGVLRAHAIVPTSIVPTSLRLRLSAARRLLAGLLLLALGGLLSGCAGWGPVLGGRVEPGLVREVVLTRWGQPTAVFKLNGGERLQYSLQPRGQQAWMVDLDAAGRVQSVRQVLTAADFARIETGRWTRADVEREFGPAAQIDRVWGWAGDVMTYRWNDGTDMFFWVYLDRAGTVQRTQTGMEFLNAPSDRD